MKKKKLKIKNICILAIILVFIGACIYIFTRGSSNTFFETSNVGYLGNNIPIVKIYNKKESDNEYTLEESKEVTRGNKITYYPSSKLIYKEEDYLKIKYDEKIYYVLEKNIVKNEDDIVMEAELYVRTSYNLHKDIDSSKLLKLVTKGSKVEIIGYDKLNDDGTVNMYKVKVNEEEGYFYSQYLVSTEEEALKNYDEDGIYQTHLARKGTLNGGSAGNLDYYPVEKVTFKDNKMPEQVYALYINGSGGIKNSIDKYIEYAKTTKINAFVVDIKDNTVPAYKGDVFKDYSKTSYEKANNSIEDYKYAINQLKENGFYVIGRITTFKDNYYVNDNNASAISKKDGTMLLHQKSYWPSPYNRDVWEFNVELAKEAVNLFGFNEIQFDYVRFPDRLVDYEKAGTIDYKNLYNEEKAQAIQRFLMYATNELHKLEVYVSADVFGESSWGYVTAYGQYWPALSNVIDAISAMPYTDHFENDKNTWEKPYDTILKWAKTAAERQIETPSPATARTWITAYDTPYWSPYVTYNGTVLEKQITALYDAGLMGGYMTWNSGSNLEKYKTQFSAFNREYGKND